MDTTQVIRGLLAIIDAARDRTDGAEPPPDASCPECTGGAVPNHRNKGPCAEHRARAMVAEVNCNPGNVDECPIHEMGEDGIIRMRADSRPWVRPCVHCGDDANHETAPLCAEWKRRAAELGISPR